MYIKQITLIATPAEEGKAEEALKSFVCCAMYLYLGANSFFSS
jgi:hypothetical protein